MSRRSVLRGAAGAGAAGIAVTALSGLAVPAFAASAKPARSAPRDAKPGTSAAADDADTGEPIVVHVRDARSGQIDVFRGTSQTSLHDPELAARLARASRG